MDLWFVGVLSVTAEFTGYTRAPPLTTVHEQLQEGPSRSRAPPMRRRGERPGHSATTAHFQAAYPFLGMGALGAPGVYVGTDAFGGAWAFDPWELYARRAIRSPNMIVMGDIAHLKSSLIKVYLYRQYVFGPQFWILDVKGEYGPFAAALGYPTIRLEPGGELRLNAIVNSPCFGRSRWPRCAATSNRRRTPRCGWRSTR
jgi:hypothetical protein